jgi:hypothetical protein
MADPEHLEMLKQGVPAWNRWRQVTPELLRPADLHGADLAQADLTEANLTQADLNEANLRGTALTGASLSRAEMNRADLTGADLQGACLSATFLIGANCAGANLSRTDLIGAHLDNANLQRANLQGADLLGATLWDADLRGADLRGARLIGATLIECNFENANLSGCWVYGTSVWRVKLAGATQLNLKVSDQGEPEVTVDNLEVAQFIYLLLNNQKIRQIIDTITSKVVLILGRFTPERKPILDAIRGELRKHDYLPVLFDFEKPANRDLTETISTLAHMARFIIADITDARSIPQELTRIVPNLPSVPVQPLLLRSKDEFGTFEHFQRFPWVLKTAS